MLSVGGIELVAIFETCNRPPARLQLSTFCRSGILEAFIYGSILKKW